MKPIILILSIVFSAILLTNKKGKSNGNQLGLYDISKDDKSIIFSYSDGFKSSIFQIDTNGKKLKEIIPAKNDTNYFGPKYSPDKKKILFLGRRNNKTNNSTLYISNLDGTDRERVTDGNDIITEAAFSECTSKIYYCKGNFFGHYSPFRTNEIHDVDIFELDLVNRSTKRVTNFKAYGIFHISEFNCEHILMYIPVQSKGGMILFSKNNPNNFLRLNPKNNPRGDYSMYDTPVYSKKFNSLAFIATYQLMIMDFNKKVSNVVVNHAGKPQIENLALFNTQKKILYTVNNDLNFNIVNYDGSNKKTIHLTDIPK